MALNDEPTWAIFAGGGTAGHLLPGLAVAQALVARGRDPASIHFVGSNRGVEADLVSAAGFTLDELSGRGIQRKLSLQNASAVIGLVRAAAAGVGIVRRRRPAVVVSLGGHAAFACALAAVVLRVPLVLLEQNVRAGAVNRLLRRFAAAAAVSFEGTDLRRAVITGNPLRPALRRAAVSPDRAAARAQLHLPPGRTVVAVFTGSQGSRRVNEATLALVARWSRRRDLAVHHVTGTRDHAQVVAARPPIGAKGIDYQQVAFEDRMDLLLAAADVAVTRAGAGTCCELAAFGVPAVMVPLPIATRDHQTANADVLVAAGGAVRVPDAELDVDRLARELGALIDDPDRRRRMAAGMRSLGRLDAADRVADVVEAQARG